MQIYIACSLFFSHTQTVCTPVIRSFRFKNSFKSWSRDIDNQLKTKCTLNIRVPCKNLFDTCTFIHRNVCKKIHTHKQKQIRCTYQLSRQSGTKRSEMEPIDIELLSKMQLRIDNKQISCTERTNRKCTVSINITLMFYSAQNPFSSSIYRSFISHLLVIHRCISLFHTRILYFFFLNTKKRSFLWCFARVSFAFKSVNTQKE